VRDENLKARALAGAGKLKEERKTRTHRERTRSILIPFPTLFITEQSAREGGEARL
jgi:hypothetical protein